MSVLNKLKIVQRRSPVEIRPRVARVIDAIANSYPNGVDAPVTKKFDKADSAMSELEDNADSFLVLMRTLPKKHPFKKLVSGLAEASDSLMSKLTEAGTELEKILSVDEQDLPGIKASALGQLAELLKEESQKIAEVQELGKMLSALAGRAHKEEKTTPVSHSLPGKEVGSGKEEEEGIGDESPDLDLNETASSPAAGGTPPPSPAPNLSSH